MYGLFHAASDALRVEYPPVPRMLSEWQMLSNVFIPPRKRSVAQRVVRRM